MSESKSPPPRGYLPALQTSIQRSSPFLDYIRYSDFKRLLGKVAATIEQQKVKTLAILSPEPQEGKTFFTVALALGHAVLLQKRVLIVNTALRNSMGSLQLKQVFESELQFHAPHRMIDLISPQTEEQGNHQSDMVDFMIGDFIENFKRDYDLILIDTCALSSTGQRMIDPIVIAGQSDASIFLTSEKSMKRESLDSVKALISQWEVRALGVIDNSRKTKAGGNR